MRRLPRGSAIKLTTEMVDLSAGRGSRTVFQEEGTARREAQRGVEM